MSFSTLVSDLAFKDSSRSTETTSQTSKPKSFLSTAATSVSISGDISSQLHGGYSHPLTRAWQAERQLTKVCSLLLMFESVHANSYGSKVNAHLSALHLRSTR